jgi:large subunit ribosomal protein L22
MAEKKKVEKKTAPKKAEAKAKPAEAAAPAKAAPAKAETAKPAAPARPGAAPAGPHASLHFLRLAPRKVRLVADHLRGMQVGAALALLRYTPNAAAKPLAKLVRSAIANAEQKGGRVDVDRLFVRTLTVDGGPKMRRYMPRAMGRAYRIEKRTSHVYVELGTGARA